MDTKEPLKFEDDKWHQCHFCGTAVNEGYESNGNRHFLSDCRRDLVEHEIGDVCTWSYRRLPEFKDERECKPPYEERDTCYAYQDIDLKWTDEHIHFYPDAPM
jgi:hypothetical protein